MTEEDRYIKLHRWGKVEFRLGSFSPAQDDCRYLLIKIIDQAIRDYINLEKSTVPIDQQYYDTAINFLFDNKYRIDYGGKEMSFEDMLSAIDIESEVAFYRKRVEIMKKLKIEKKKQQ